LKYKITFKKSVSRDLNKLGKSQAKIILDRIDNELSSRADQYPQLKGRFSGLRKCRIGDYRVIFSLFNDTVLITRIKHRKEVYR